MPSPSRGVLLELLVAPGEHVKPGQPLALIRHDAEAAQQPEATGQGAEAGGQGMDGSREREDLARVLAARHAITDDGRVEGGDSKFAERKEQRHARGQLTARENIAALLDIGSDFFEYGRFAVAAQSGRVKSIDELRKRTPADGLVCGVGTVNGAEFGQGAAKAAVVAYDATVLAGTQGYFNHLKLDRIVEVAEAQCLPLVLFAEGGGGRPGDTDVDPIANSQLGVSTFARLSRLSGRVPLVGLTSGFCFAGNAALLGTCDVIIATEGSNIGMAGPAMVEGGGLGRVKPTAIGPAAEGASNGVVDILVKSEAEAVRAAQHYLSFFQGSKVSSHWHAPDQTALRHAVPENRKRTYEMRNVAQVASASPLQLRLSCLLTSPPPQPSPRLLSPREQTLADEGSWLELRRGFAPGLISGLCRIAGHSVGVLANSPDELGGAVDSDGALKAARFMELCDAFSVPLLFLCDTPGFMVGVEHEKSAAVRKLSRMFAVAASLSVVRTRSIWHLHRLACLIASR